MANTYTELTFHAIWSTKHRQLLIQSSFEQGVWASISSVGRTHDIAVLRAGGIENHVHALIQIPKTMSISEAMKRLKGGSSKHINDEAIVGPNVKFGWQDGYAAFSVSTSNLESVARYIATQREHHRRSTFEEEYVAYLERHGIEYDPAYVFD